MKIKIDYNKCKPEDRKYLMHRIDIKIGMAFGLVVLFWMSSTISLLFFNLLPAISYLILELLCLYYQINLISDYEKIYNVHFKYSEKKKNKTSQRMNRNLDYLACILWIIVGEGLVILYPTSFIECLGIIIISISAFLLGCVVKSEENGRR